MFLASQSIKSFASWNILQLFLQVVFNESISLHVPKFVKSSRQYIKHVLKYHQFSVYFSPGL